MKYAVDQQERYTVFKVLEENLNLQVAPGLKTEFLVLFDKGVGNLIVDLSEVQYVDSSGLSAILTADRLWKDLGSFLLTGINHPMVKKLFEISRLDSVLVIIPTLEEAIEYLFMEEIERELGQEEGKEEEEGFI